MLAEFDAYGKSTTEVMRWLWQDSDDPRNSKMPSHPSIHSHLEEVLREDLVKKLKKEGVLAGKKIVMGLGNEQKINAFVLVDAHESGNLDVYSSVSVAAMGLTTNQAEGYHIQLYKLPFTPCDEVPEIQDYTETEFGTWPMYQFEPISHLLRFLYENTETWALSIQMARNIVRVYENPQFYIKKLNHHHFSEGYWNE